MSFDNSNGNAYHNKITRLVYGNICEKKLFQTNKYSQFSLIISTLKKNKIYFQVNENDIHARYGLLGIDKATTPYIPRKTNIIYSIYVKKKDYDTALFLLHSLIGEEDE